MTKTSLPKIGLAFLHKHSAVLDTAQGTNDFPSIQITMALTDEMQKCNSKPITIRTKNKHTVSAQSTRIIYMSIRASNLHPIPGTVQPLPQFDECAKLIIAPGVTTAREKRVAIKIINTTDFPYTITPNTKLAELQILNPKKNEIDPFSWHSSAEPTNRTRRRGHVHQYPMTLRKRSSSQLLKTLETSLV